MPRPHTYWKIISAGCGVIITFLALAVPVPAAAELGGAVGGAVFGPVGVGIGTIIDLFGGGGGTNSEVLDTLLFPFKFLFSMVVVGVPYIIGTIGSLMFQLGALMVEIGFSLNGAILTGSLQLPDGTVLYDFVEVGFGIALQVANLGFVLALIIIAFATILGYNEKFGMKALLGKLILYAVLVNFSLFIAGLFIDFGQVLTDAFLRAGASGDSIATALSPQKLLLDTLSVDTA